LWNVCIKAFLAAVTPHKAVIIRDREVGSYRMIHRAVAQNDAFAVNESQV
jgi:hypothetical protein